MGATTSNHYQALPLFDQGRVDFIRNKVHRAFVGIYKHKIYGNMQQGTIEKEGYQLLKRITSRADRVALTYQSELKQYFDHMVTCVEITDGNLVNEAMVK